MARLRFRYDRAGEQVREAREQLTKAKALYDTAEAALSEAVAEFKAVQDEFDALEQAARTLTAPAGVRSALVVPSPPAVPPPVPKNTTPVSVPPNLQDLIDAFPKTGDIKKTEIMRILALGDTVVHTRLQKAKKLGLVESIDWGLYGLTDAGKKARGRKLQVVS